MSEEMTLKEKKKAIEKTLAEYRKKNPSAQVGVGDTSFGKITTINSGILALDKLTKGFPRGLYSHIAGPSGVGKSTLALRLIAELQKNGMICALANNERRYSSEWAAANGVDIKALIGGNFPDLEACLDFLVKMAESPVDCIVVDTITALASRNEIVDKKGERSTGDNTMAQIPRKLSQFFRMATARIHDSQMVVILINQIRKDLSNTVFVKDIATGGNALEHNKSLDIFLRRTAKKEWPTSDEEVYSGHAIKATLLKCTYTMQAREGDEIKFCFLKGRGFSNGLDVVWHAREAGLIAETGRGKWTYTPKQAGAVPVEIQASKWTVDMKMEVELTSSGRLGELIEWFETLATGNVGVVEKIELDKEAEAEE